MADSINLSDLGDYLEDDKLELKGITSTTHPDGKTYYVTSPDAKTGLQLAGLAQIMMQVGMGHKVSEAERNRINFDDDEERDLMQRTLGDAMNEMIDDGVSWVKLRGVSQYAFFYYGLGKQQADLAAQNGVFSGKGPAPTRAQKRAKPTTQSARQGSAATKSRPAVKRKPQAKG